MRQYVSDAVRMLRIVAAASLIVVIIGSFAIPMLPVARAATVSVEIKSFAFNPSTITIDIGDTVIWYQNDSTSHTVTSTTPVGELASPTMTNGQTYSHTFLTAGTFNYHCSIHTSMTGSVVVIDTSIPEFSSTPLVVLGMLVLAIALLVAGRKG